LASQLRFEGPELEELLDRVRKEVGSDANIVAANRIRKGGIGGFFAREGFEVLVDVSDESRLPKAPQPKSRRPQSVLDLVDEMNASEREQVIDLSEAPSVSTETPDFGSLLAKLSRELDEEEAGMPMPDTQPVSPRAHYRRVTESLPPPAPPLEEAAGEAVIPPVHEPIPIIEPSNHALAPTPLPALETRLAALGLPAEMIPSNNAQADVRTALVQRLAQLPPPPMLPRTPGVVIAVVGIGTAPIALARRLADEMDIVAEHIVLSTPEPVSELSNPDEAETFRRGCRRRLEPTVVACSIGAGRAQLGWAHRMLDKLEPTVTWAVVEASCKPEDIGHRVSLLGGADVLALTGVTDTVSPAGILRLNIPVGRIGPTPATPASWADLLMERLERGI
jgi:hypothetical protein